MSKKENEQYFQSFAGLMVYHLMITTILVGIRRKLPLLGSVNLMYSASGQISCWRKGMECMNIFVGGLVEDVTKERLEKTFGVYGKVNSATLVRDPGGAPRGFAYVEMPVNGEAMAAISALNGRARMGSSLEVHQICRPGPRPRSQRPASRYSPGGSRRQAAKVAAAKTAAAKAPKVAASKGTTPAA